VKNFLLKLSKRESKKRKLDSSDQEDSDKYSKAGSDNDQMSFLGLESANMKSHLKIKS